MKQKGKNRSWEIPLMVILCCAAMAVVDGVIRPEYAVKSVVKAALFLGCPLLYFRRRPGERPQALFCMKGKSLALALGLGAGVFGLILGAYFLLRDRFDFSGITGALAQNVGVDRSNFLWVALYISLVNSLLEEFFFRGFAFLTLKRHISRGAAYAFSAAAFALYHAAMLEGWFSPALYALTMAGLAAGALLFNYMDEKGRGLLPSWAVHVCANFGVNVIGCLLMGIL